MKVALLDGSPQPNKSASLLLLEAIKGFLGKKASFSLLKAKLPGDFKSLMANDSLVLAFPLYVDTFPSQVIAFLEEFAIVNKDLPENSKSPKLYVIVNCGFHETSRSLLVLEQCRLFAMKANLSWGQGLAIGGGPLTLMFPDSLPKGIWPFGKYVKALKTMASNILKLVPGPDLESSPSMPRWLYNMGANHHWKVLIKKNGLPVKDLYKVYEP
ncbi:MAG: hypothetical protein LBE38_06550 [Deltaproteobacteria bacterium]|jgi:hypothetical protein|nr:hypothetical protein [Deltaproteobacteria bacterium]